MTDGTLLRINKCDDGAWEVVRLGCQCSRYSEAIYYPIETLSRHDTLEAACAELLRLSGSEAGPGTTTKEMKMRKILEIRERDATDQKVALAERSYDAGYVLYALGDGFYAPVPEPLDMEFRHHIPNRAQLKGAGRSVVLPEDEIN